MGSGLEKTRLFLSILEALDNPEESCQLRFVAYEELRRTEIWMQIYALPHVLASLRREDDLGGVQEPLHAYFRELNPRKGGACSRT